MTASDKRRGQKDGPYFPMNMAKLAFMSAFSETVVVDISRIDGQVWTLVYSPKQKQ